MERQTNHNKTIENALPNVLYKTHYTNHKIINPKAKPIYSKLLVRKESVPPFLCSFGPLDTIKEAVILVKILSIALILVP